MVGAIDLEQAATDLHDAIMKAREDALKILVTCSNNLDPMPDAKKMAQHLEQVSRLKVLFCKKVGDYVTDHGDKLPPTW